ncbi:filamentous hemagglutinin N-terminal domain-containing protein [Vibrio tubiashii]|uniref:Filamentous hemagglutinin N-terminal domain-containing protein n=1 Tax=Vibrio tubiashii TaxID=29498 RepID=A0AAE5GR88_9VIBR|nr:hemagglutinin repeat-containing protein [Vibrio tubiashii]NOI81671.1 filamentous hemagglutinin N-terminal domain-containing protein [Vibrio tubiashii]
MNKKLTLGKVCLTYALCGVITLQPVFANVVIDGNSGNTSKTAAGNGVEVINIATPNNQGLSHNKYQQFNVDPSGLILNNSTAQLAQSQLGGLLQNNPNLKGQAANVILNEVTGANRSQLEGYTEVFGQQANVILANPYGITCDGCGFINTPRVTLSTGTPDIQNGLVSGFDVAEGSVTIEGLGLDATRQTYFDIISRTAEINANIHANDLSIVTGVNKVEYQTNKASEKSSGSVSNKPKLAIDSSSLGGMYAGRISLVATEDGVGVNVGNLVANGGDIVLTADGTIQLAAANSAGDIVVQGTNKLELTGKQVADNRYSAKASNVKLTNATIVGGKVVSLDAEQSTIAEKSNLISGLSKNGTSSQNAVLKIKSKQLILQESQLSSHGEFTSEIDQLSLDSNSGIKARHATLISVSSLKNNGQVHSENSLNITGAEMTLAGSGSIQANRVAVSSDNTHIQTTITGDTVSAHSVSKLTIAQDAKIAAKSHLNLQSHTLEQNGVLSTQGSATLTAKDLKQSATGSIAADSDLSLISDTQKLAGSISSQGKVLLQGKELHSDGVIKAKQIEIESTEKVLIAAPSQVLSAEHASINTKVLTNNGQIKGGSISVQSAASVEQNGTIASQASLEIDVASLTSSSDIVAQGDLRISATGDVTNNANLLAGKALSLTSNTLSNKGQIKSGSDTHLDVKQKLNNASSGIVSGNKTTITANELTNAGTLQALDAFNLTVSSLVNRGSIVALGDGTLSSAGAINNQGVIYAGNNAYLYSDSLHNTADIVVGNNLLIARNSEKQKNTSVTNSSGTIESLGGNIGIYTGTIKNIRSTLKTTSTSFLDKRSQFGSEFNANGTAHAASYKRETQCYTKCYNTDKAKHHSVLVAQSGKEFEVKVYSAIASLLTASPASRIVASKNLTISAVNVFNDASQIAGNIVKISADLLDNKGYDFYSVDTYYKYKLRYGTVGGESFNSFSYPSESFKNIFDLSSSRTENNGVNEHLSSSISATNSLTLNVTNKVNNSTLKANATAVTPTKAASQPKQTSDTSSIAGFDVNYLDTSSVAFPKFVFPARPNGLFVTSPDPSGKYLIETNPALTNMEEFLGSDYFLSKVGFNPEKNVKFLGDAFYDNRLISQAIFEQTGKQFLNREVGSQLEQMQQLLDSAGEQKQALELSIGVALTPEQISQLTSDMVWYEEVEVNGQKVLAPKLYLARATLNHVESGAQIAAENVEINGGSLENSGVLIADKSLDINSGDSISNIGGKIASNGTVSLKAKNDVTNISGDILGQDIEIRSTDGSFINETKVTKTSASLGNNSGTFTDVGKTARVTSNGELLIDVGKNVENSAATISSTGNAIIKAGENIVVDSKENTQSYDVRFRRGRVSESNTTQLVSSITSGGNLELESGNSLTISASEASATGNLSLKAQNDITIQTALNEQSDHLSNSYRTDINRSTQHQGSSLSGSSVSMNSGGKVTVSGSLVSATDVIDISAKEDVSILAVNDSQYHFDQTVSKKSFGRSSTTTNETYREQVKGSSIRAGKDIRIKAQNLDTVITAGGESDIHIIGSELNAGGEVELSADGDINLAAQTYKTFERHETIKKGFGGLSKRNKGTLEDATLLNSSYLINSGNTSINAGKDIGVIASEVTSGGEVNLNAVEDVLIAAGDVLKKSQQWDEKMSFLSGGNLFEMEKKRQGEETSTAQSSSIQSGGNLTVNGGSVKVVGSELNADNNVSLTADTGDVEILAAKETTKTFQSEEKVAISLGEGFEGVSLEDGRLKVSLGDAKYDKVKQQSEALNHKGSLVNADNNLVIDAESSIMVEGSKLASDADQNNHGDLSLRANNDITIKEAVDTFREQREEIHGTAEASVVVQHQAVEVAKAAKALKDSTDNLKQAKKDYKQYKKSLDSLQTTLATLEQEYKAKKPGVIYEDIEELQDLVSEVKSDEAWYVAGVALATEDVVSKTTNLYQQTAALATSASSCAYCLGFNAGIQLDIDASKTSTSTQGTTSIASNLSGQNILIKAGNAEGSQANIQGSRLAAKDKLELSADEVNITASKNTEQNKTDNKSGSVSASMTVFGATTGINLNASYDRNQSTSSSITHNNSQLNADNITITSTQDTNIKGATVAANESLTVDVGGDLNVASVQDRHSSSHKGMGISGGISLTGGQTAGKNEKQPQGTLKNMDGAGDLAGANGGINASNGRTRTKQTVLTSLTSGGSADITVANNTDVKGALIATRDENGQDSGKLNLTTNSLTYADLSNTNYSQNKSVGISAGYSFKAEEQKQQGQNDGSTSKDNNDPTKDDSKFNSSSYQYTNTSGYSKSKTLATIGQGQLTIADSENSDDTSRLNRDTEHTEKDLFTVDRKQGDIDVTVDHRLLTEKGRNQIAEDILITDMFRESLERAITTERVGITDFFDETGKQLNVYNAVKQSIADDPSLAAKLQDPDLPAEAKEQMLDQLTHAAIKSLGYDAEGYDNKIIAKDDDVRQGFYSEETKDSYINDSNINDTEGLVNVAGHEMSHAIDDQSGDVNKYSEQDRETYAENIGEDFVDYTDTALGVNGHGSMASTNNHVGNTSGTVVNNTHEYNGLDKSKGDNLIFAVPVVYEVGMAVTAATAAYLQANPEVAASIYDTLSESAENAGRTLNEMLTIDPKLTDKELDVQAVVVSSLLKDLEDQSRSTEDKLEIYRLIDEYDPKAVELAKERAKAISPNTGGSKIVENNNTTYTNPIDEGYDSSTVTEVGGSIDASTETVATTEQGLGSTESPAESGVDPLLVVTSESYIPAPKNINGISGLTIAKSKTSVQGGGKLRRRWKDSKGNIYEWDYQHGEVEKYNKRGKHLGQFNPETGEQTKPADKTRKVEP